MNSKKKLHGSSKSSANKSKRRPASRPSASDDQPWRDRYHSLGRLQRYAPQILTLLLIVTTISVFWPATTHHFVNFDDNLYVTENPHVRRGLSSQSIAWALTSTTASNWHPLTWISHISDVSLWGASADAAFGHHLTNIAIHSINAALVFNVLRLLTGQMWTSVLAAALFAWHPLRVESVAWIAERKDLLSGFFWLAAITCYCHYVNNRTSWWRYLLVIVCYACGLMSKPMVITLPFALLLLDFWPLKRLPWTSPFPSFASLLPLLREKLPMFLLVPTSASITYYAQLVGGSIVTEKLSFWSRLTNALISYWVYLKQFLWPSQLAVFYPLIDGGQSSMAALMAGALLSVASVASVLLRHRLPFVAVGWFWYLGTLIPVIGLVQVGGQAHADRYTYLPLIGIGWILSGLLAQLVCRWPRAKKAVVVAVAIMLLASVLATRHQLQFWRDSVTLFARAAEISPGSALAWSNLGAAQLSAGKPNEAIELYQRANRIAAVPASQAGLATALAASGNWTEAISTLEKLIADDPKNHKVANNLAWILATAASPDVRNSARAVRLSLQAQEHSGGADPAILDTLAAAYAADGQFERAVQTAELAISLALEMKDADMAKAIGTRRELFLSRRPYFETH